MTAVFDPVMKEHLRRIKDHVTYTTYLGCKIQNELIQMLASEVRKTILAKVRRAKYFSIILDCTPDVSHKEQMSIVIRCLDDSESSTKVEEYWVQYLEVDDTSGLGIFMHIKNALVNLDLDINDIRGQGYDNGSNMKGRHKEGIILFLEEFREDGYDKAMVEAKEMTCEMGIEAVFQEKRVVRRKKNNLVKLQLTDDEVLLRSCKNLESSLTHRGCSDISGDDLFSELTFLKCSLPREAKTTIDVVNYLKKMDGCFSNAQIAYKILLTIPVTVASAERSFSKLKLIKTFLRSTMSEERLNGLAMLSIEKEVTEQLDYTDLISIFSSKIVRRVAF
ncbi:uncharacterized protein [Henckelia pumila]|uniref:uncharacterized protein n=1 Tax=Henckelia pumila TaxID=405737 RepID=UPI003C6E9760